MPTTGTNVVILCSTVMIHAFPALTDVHVLLASSQPMRDAHNDNIYGATLACASCLNH